MAVSRLATRGEKLQALVASPGFQAIKSLSIGINSVVRIELTITCRQTDGAHRATFKRTGLFYRISSGPVLIQGSTWLADQTVKSDPNIDISYSLGATSLDIRVKNAGNTPTQWLGSVEQVKIN